MHRKLFKEFLLTGSFIRGFGGIECDIDFNLPVKRKRHSLQHA